MIMKTKFTIQITGISILLLLIFCAVEGLSQDFHLSQYDAVPMIQNPANTGMKEGRHYSASAMYRSQWRPISSRPFSTFILAYDMPLEDRWGIGGYLVNSDGANVFNTFQLTGSVAYRITRQRRRSAGHHLSVGGQLGMMYKTTARELVFNNQYNPQGGGYSSDIPNYEDIENYSKVLPEISMGANYRYVNDQETIKPFASFSIWHITSPKEGFLSNSGGDVRLPRRYNLLVGSRFLLQDRFILEPKINTNIQGQATEYIFGADLETTFEAREDILGTFGVHHRLKDAIIIIAGIEYKGLLFTMSFDINTTELSEYVKGSSAMEFSLIFAPRTGRVNLFRI
ncbi:MAG TPA: hypothetical protein DDX92_14320 [Flavobacteriales bacterium]|jgi:type IX secretion system PorP/SprF family membrane protein|nr:hypothetical protein [Flavobacteriales bacterium]